ncbi:hypothetical protein UPYG_G00175360 [Umbra pygmaea]|uniref:Uncharacterized protein n=1 Tax=Umbra pygmaea TaxID=75934 RepID=A0ABD0WPN7_UMBPY
MNHSPPKGVAPAARGRSPEGRTTKTHKQAGQEGRPTIPGRGRTPTSHCSAPSGTCEGGGSASGSGVLLQGQGFQGTQSQTAGGYMET